MLAILNHAGFSSVVCPRFASHRSYSFVLVNCATRAHRRQQDESRLQPRGAPVGAEKDDAGLGELSRQATRNRGEGAEVMSGVLGATHPSIAK